jgi:hypothetical protein
MAQKKDNMLTPRGVAIYPHLNEPDTKWKANGEFHVKLAFDADDPQVQEFREKLEAARDARYQEAYDELVKAGKTARAKELKKVEVLKVETDDETGEETGRLIVKVGMQHKVTPKSGKHAGKTILLKPDYFNGRREELKKPPKIGGGSTLRCFVDPFAYLNEKDKVVGVSLRLQAVQIIKLVSYGARDPGFEVEDDADDIVDDEAPFEADEPATGGTADDDDI